jgi:hypothetical protein
MINFVFIKHNEMHFKPVHISISTNRFPTLVSTAFAVHVRLFFLLISELYWLTDLLKKWGGGEETIEWDVVVKYNHIP